MESSEMKRDKEWLKNEIENMGSETSENYPHEQMVDREEVLNLIDQLDEPEKVVIPRFVATFIEDSRNKVGNVITAIWEMYDYEYEDVYEWALEDGNDEVLMKAFVNGYEVEKEKEKLYYIELIKGKRCMAQVAGGACWFPYGRKDVLTGVDKIKFTESEIKAIDERFWAFAVEVAE